MDLFRSTISGFRQVKSQLDLLVKSHVFSQKKKKITIYSQKTIVTSQISLFESAK